VHQAPTDRMERALILRGFVPRLRARGVLHLDADPLGELVAGLANLQVPRMPIVSNVLAVGADRFSARGQRSNRPRLTGHVRRPSKTVQ